ncbi:sigma-70 family RNA polymerase sigma factor [Saccharibacillus sp. CPCC 101409]|uniref:sigma-70 family RNA polymerase sigma factor n=1 Tax=Saccharibacillus sp. CPCC 101409 TaxID=3058041 RepID=UPI0026732242|nr:sigma-70 family RNA polymerase sigma factor [Saccharibacillus sp. CPCC 101409]MDO3413250.1 sigma-70 family RNA polymerase sigma factor [Saccharibacillus sp. CPCC 101409]
MINEELVLRARDGDREAFVDLMRQTEDALHGMAWSMLRKEEDVADAMQETVFKAYRSIASLRAPAFFRTWIFRILINECHTLLRGRSRTVTMADFPAAASKSSDYDEVDMRDAVDRLEEKQRVVVILHYFEDLSIAQVAETLELTESAVKTRLMRARAALMKKFQFHKKGSMNYESI